MKQRLILVIFILHLLLSSKVFGQNPNFSYPYNYSKKVYVSRVIDGDTFVLSDSQHVRMLGVNCPEIAKQNKPAEPFANQAAQKIISLIEHKTVKLTFEGRAFDIFGRLLAYVWSTNSQGKDSLFVQAELLKNGLSRISYYTKEKRYYSLFYNLRNTARKKKLGIWSIE
ncbi:MAG: micrococcal nuclease [Ignavibacteria bacterium]|nr:MAG: micrococcal nuclease [Ignavibacteria bacterium]KAF0154170.1 MAG: micrococcal nuclease [Ignavibacteria bacterium]